MLIKLVSLYSLVISKLASSPWRVVSLIIYALILLLIVTMLVATITTLYDLTIIVIH